MSFAKLKEKRDTFHTKSVSTLGPGSYDIAKPSKNRRKSAPAPFLSTTARNTLQENPPSDSPGPGSYALDEPPATRAASRHHKAFGSESKRFSGSSSGPIPGPGSYELGSEWAPRTSYEQIRENQPTYTPHLYWQTGSVVPSIPSNNYGYSVLPNGEVAQIKAPRQQIIQESTVINRPRTTGPDFSRASSRQTKFIQKETIVPGPGDYDLTSDLLPDRASRLRHTSGGYAFGASQQPRFATVQSEVLNEPGPSDYAPYSPVRISKPKQPMRGSTVPKKERVVVKPVGPGPGSYKTEKSPFLVKKSYSRASFNSVAPRFSHQDPENFDESPDAIPGPGSYDIPASGSGSGSGGPPRAYYRGTPTSFGIQDRFPKLNPNENPAPGQYHNDEPKRVQHSDTKKPSHMFMSTTGRLNNLRIDDDIPPVGTYYSEENGTGVGARKKPGASFPQASRKIELTVDNKTPGPGEYSADVIGSKQLPNRRSSPPPFGAGELRFRK